MKITTNLNNATTNLNNALILDGIFLLCMLILAVLCFIILVIGGVRKGIIVRKIMKFEIKDIDEVSGVFIRELRVALFKKNLKELKEILADCQQEVDEQTH